MWAVPILGVYVGRRAWPSCHALPTFEVPLRFAREATAPWCAEYRYGRRFGDGYLGIWNEGVDVNVRSPCRATGNCSLQYLSSSSYSSLERGSLPPAFPLPLSPRADRPFWIATFFPWLTLRLFFIRLIEGISCWTSVSRLSGNHVTYRYRV